MKTGLRSTLRELVVANAFQRAANPQETHGGIFRRSTVSAPLDLFVLAFHWSYNSDLSRSSRFALALGAAAGRTGALGVLVFFCISGYLITTRLLWESRASDRIGLRAFYIKRVFRILPPLAVYLIALLLLSGLGWITLLPSDWSAAVFLANYFPGSWFTSHFWSLSVEEHFYLFWPLCIYLVGWRRSMYVGVVIILAVAAWRPYVLAHLGAMDHPASYLQHTDLRADYLMAGCVLAVACSRYAIARRLVVACSSSIAFAGLLVLLMVTTLAHVAVARSAQCLVLTLLVCGSAMGANSIPARALSVRPLLFLGRISYSVYIWQQLFLAHVQLAWWNAPAAILIKLPLILGAALLSYYFVERPAISFGRSLIKRPRAAEISVPVLGRSA